VTDTELADELVLRLNKLIEDPDVRKDIGALIETRVPCSKATLDHPTIQAGWSTKEDFEKQTSPKLGILGLLNGIVGVYPDGTKKGWGLVSANFDEGPLGVLTLKSFSRTVNNATAPT
jgi:hypothetical protein